eukprot:TRINITY_DN267_c0_g1_i14.p1 TRINITY_DN267_c0_g1~~TRINITY_DN267_c0_g1_i14.p1  ORF type:complete len:278 (-),score=42.62 TRINITY_DN267_c0_g1_i14:347-1180(-)
MKPITIVLLASIAAVVSAMPLSPEQSDAILLWRARHAPRGGLVGAGPPSVTRNTTTTPIRSKLGSIKSRGVTEASGYSEDYAVQGMYLAGAAYCTSSAQQSWSCGPCKQVSGMQVEQTFAFPSTATYGYIGYIQSQNLIVVAFRGTTPTSSLQSILQDLKFFKTDPLWGIPGALVHKGFYESYISAQSVVHSAVSSLLQDYPSAQVGVFGHSLGGAMATLCALDLVLNVRITQMSSVVTVGQPRVGNQAFASFYDQAVTQPYGHYRVVHYRGTCISH